MAPPRSLALPATAAECAGRQTLRVPGRASAGREAFGVRGLPALGGTFRGLGKRARLGLAWLTLFAVIRAWAGGSGLNVIVVVNQNSTNSVRLGTDYCEQRGVPPQNLLRMTGWTGGAISWYQTDLQSRLLNPLLGMLASRKLTNQAQFVLLSMDIPYSVSDGSSINSTTSALFYGFKTNDAPPGAICWLPDPSSNSYAFSELPLSASRPGTAATNSFLTMMLTDSNLAGAELVLSHGVASDSTFPTQTVYLVKTTDTARNVRFAEFDNTVFDCRIRGESNVVRISSSSTTSFTNLLGVMEGLAVFTLPANAFVPGAMADTLTSTAGKILTANGQTPALVFLEAGAVGTYGTVTEPCNYTQKFPSPEDYFYQYRGFSLAEAYYQSVLNPYQGLMLGEPLSAPFASPGTADWSSLAEGAVLTGQATLSPVFSASATNLPLGQVDLFVDGTFFQTMTNLPPMAGNLLSVTLNGVPTQYTVPANATLASAVTGLAAVINGQSNATQVIAYPTGDRLEFDGLDWTKAGSQMTLSASTAVGSAGPLTAELTPARSTFLDTVATGYAGFAVSNAPLVGDWVQFVFTKTNGTVVKVGVTNTTSGLTNNIGLAQNLIAQINATAALQSADGVTAADLIYESSPPMSWFNLYARSPGWGAAQIQMSMSSASNLTLWPSGTNALVDNVTDLRPRNHLYLTSGATWLPVNNVLDTTQLADGFHTLTAVAYEGSSVRTQTRVSHTVQIHNTPLTATLTPIISGTNTTLEDLLQFAVSANTTNLARLELFSTGGSIGVASNQPAAVFPASFATLGVGLHPFYAVATDRSGNQYQTPTQWFRFPLVLLSLAGPPWTLSWPALPGLRYDVLGATNVSGPFQAVASITATNSPGQWAVPLAGPAGFYRVRATP